jgi:predicted MPP superfamily phosphohydrolase
VTQDDARQLWYRQRRKLEQGYHFSTPDGLVRHPRLGHMSPALHLFSLLLRLTGLYGRGLSNAMDVRVKHLTIKLAKLPQAFDGYRILQISDPHLDLLPELAGRIATLVQGVEADLPLLTGDYRDRHDTPPEPGLALLEPILAAIEAPDGHYAIMGNHDPADGVPILEAMGLKVLINQTITLTRGDAVLHLTGLDDVHYFYSEQARGALEKDIEGCRIAAVHSAEIADLAAAAGIDLYLCGHTHGGQIRLPWGPPPLNNLCRCRDYGHGQWQHGQMIGYTTNGAGVTTIPVRYNCPAEITLITLRRQDQ